MGLLCSQKPQTFLVRRLFVLGGDDEDGEREQDQTDNESDHAAAGDAADKEADEAHRRNEQRIGKLRGNVVDVVALCACGRQNRGVRDRRDVVAADRAGQAGRC